jgi:glycosyltransferase involved in cell wall biosynthesis
MNILPLLSVIIPAPNHAQFLAAALESVMNQDFENYEVIVVDDGSTDDTPSLLSREMTRGRWAGRLRVLRQSNGGPGQARNLAPQQARGRLLQPSSRNPAAQHAAHGAALGAPGETLAPWESGDRPSLRPQGRMRAAAPTTYSYRADVKCFRASRTGRLNMNRKRSDRGRRVSPQSRRLGATAQNRYLSRSDVRSRTRR